MTCKMLLFDFRDTEKQFFDKNKFDNFDIKFFKESLNEKMLENLTQEDFDNTMIISVFITSSINQKILEKFKNLRIISTRSTGYDHIDLQACLNKNIALINVEGYGNSSVAQFTFGLILILIRNFFLTIQAVKNGTYTIGKYTGRNLNNLTIGIIGTGAIGAGVCQIASGFGMKILAYDVVPKQELIQKYNIQYLPLNDVLQNSDIITLHIPATKENYQIMSEDKFKLMKDNSYFINVSRGELVKLEDLLKFIKNGKLSGVGLDVLSCNNSSNETIEELACLTNSETVKELLACPNVIITPHIAYDTQEAVNTILKVTFEGLSDCICGGKKYRVI